MSNASSHTPYPCWFRHQIAHISNTLLLFVWQPLFKYGHEQMKTPCLNSNYVLFGKKFMCQRSHVDHCACKSYVVEFCQQGHCRCIFSWDAIHTIAPLSCLVYNKFTAVWHSPHVSAFLLPVDKCCCCFPEGISPCSNEFTCPFQIPNLY